MSAGIAPNVWCFASVVPNRKLLSAQLSKTLVNRCFFIQMLKFSAFHRFF